MAEHTLKCWAEPFAAILSGEKRHEVRKNDRGFAVGDVLHLREYDPAAPLVRGFLDGPDPRYSGRTMSVRVTHLTPGGSWGLPVYVCVMSIEPVQPAPPVMRGEWDSREMLEPIRRCVGRISISADPSARDIRNLADAVAVLLEMRLDDLAIGVGGTSNTKGGGK